MGTFTIRAHLANASMQLGQAAGKLSDDEQSEASAVVRAIQWQVDVLIETLDRDAEEQLELVDHRGPSAAP